MTSVAGIVYSWCVLAHTNVGPVPAGNTSGRISPTGDCQRLFASTSYAVADRSHNIPKPPSRASEIVDNAADFEGN